MNAMFHDVLIKAYAHCGNIKGLPFWVMTPVRKIMRGVGNCVIPIWFKATNPTGCDNSSNVVVSLTSFDTRIRHVWLAVECLLRQTYRPRTVVLWLSREQFSSVDELPWRLRRLERYGLSIRMVDGDLRSHKKYVYAFKEYANDLVLLADDDLFYPSDMAEKLVALHGRYGDLSVIGRFGFDIVRNADGTPKPYKQWVEGTKWGANELHDGDDLFFGSGGGALLRPKYLDPDVCNADLAMSLAPTADDIWLNFHCKKAGYRIVMLSAGQLLPIAIRGNIRLKTVNEGTDARNDLQLNNVMNHYMNTII